MILKIIIGAFVIAWAGIIYSIITAPLVDEYGNIIKKKNFLVDKAESLSIIRELKHKN